MSENECVICGKGIGEKTACLDCTFTNMETVMKEWEWSKVSFDGKEIKITPFEKPKLTEVSSQ